MKLSKRLDERSSFRLLLIVPVLLYLSVAVFWHSRQFYGITGDEPHYLLISESVTRDRDLTIDNNYAWPTAVHQTAGVDLSHQIHLGRHTNGRFSFHNVGLPLLLAIPYWIGGVFGAKLFMALLAGFWPFLIYKVLLSVLDSHVWSVTIALVLSLGLPFLGAANQIYPDLLSGLILLYLTWTIFFRRNHDSTTSGLLSDLWIGFLIAFLPWIHVRFVAPVLLLLIANAYFRAEKTTSTSANPERRRALLPTALFVGSIILLGIYHHLAFDNVLGPYGRENATLRIKENLMIFFGFHWDQSQGLFIQQPLLLLGLIGVPVLVKASPRGSLLLLLIYLSVLAPNAMHTAWYGGYSFHGRFWWPVFCLWIFPLAHAVKMLVERNQLILWALCLGSLAFQVWLAIRWLFQDSLLFNRNVPVWASTSFFHHTRFLTYLPTFRDFDNYLAHPANLIAVLLGPLLVLSGWMWRRGYVPALGKMWAVLLVVGLGAIILISPATGSWKIKGFELPSQIGSIEGDHRVATEQNGPGVLIFGPYALLVAGNYEVAIDYDSSGMSEASNARFGAVYDQGNKVLVDVMLPPSNGNQGKAKHPFTVNQEQSLKSLFEFPVRYTGQGNLRVKELTITRIDH